MKNNSKNELSKHKTADKIKWIVAFTLLVLLAIAVVLLCLKVSGVFEKAEPTTTGDSPAESAGPMVYSPGDSYGISLMATYATTAADEKTVDVTATVTPPEAPQGLRWEISWVNKNSEWATGKNVLDYVMPAAHGDDPYTYTLIYRQGFGEQIRLRVSSTANTKIYADVMIDSVGEFEFVPLSYTWINYNATVKVREKVTTSLLDKMNLRTIFDFGVMPTALSEVLKRFPGLLEQRFKKYFSYQTNKVKREDGYLVFYFETDAPFTLGVKSSTPGTDDRFYVDIVDHLLQAWVMFLVGPGSNLDSFMNDRALLDELATAFEDSLPFVNPLISWGNTADIPRIIYGLQLTYYDPNDSTASSSGYVKNIWQAPIGFLPDTECPLIG